MGRPLRPALLTTCSAVFLLSFLAWPSLATPSSIAGPHPTGSLNVIILRTMKSRWSVTLSRSTSGSTCWSALSTAGSRP